METLKPGKDHKPVEKQDVMNGHKIFKPNIWYATYLQVLQVVIFLGIAFAFYRILVYVIDFEIIEFIVETIYSLEFGLSDIVLDLFHEKLNGIILAIVIPFVILLINIVNDRLEIENGKVVVKRGLFRIERHEFELSEIVKYKSEKDFFFGAGSVELFTLYGDKIKIQYILNLKQACKYLDDLVEKNRQHLQARLPKSDALKETEEDPKKKLNQKIK